MVSKSAFGVWRAVVQAICVSPHRALAIEVRQWPVSQVDGVAAVEGGLLGRPHRCVVGKFVQRLSGEVARRVVDPGGELAIRHADDSRHVFDLRRALCGSLTFSYRQGIGGQKSGYNRSLQQPLFLEYPMKPHRLALVALLAIGLTAHFAAAQAAAPAKAEPKAQAKTAPTTEPINRDGPRHQLINSRAIPGQVDLLFIGDSITQGWEGAGKEAWEKYFSKRKAMNAGIGGDRTQHILWRLDNGNIKGITPKAAVLMIGTNNSGTNSSEEIAAGITAIVAKLRKELPKTKILLLAIFPRGADKNDAKRKVNEGANSIIAKLADDKSVFFLDLAPKFLAEDGTLSKEIMPDLLHLSPKGYEIWASSIDAKLAELMDEKK